MLSQLSQTITFYAWFTAARQGVGGLTVTVDVYKGTASLVTSGVAAEVGGGLYRYSLAGGSTADPESYAAIFKTTDATVDAQHVPSLWIVGSTFTEALPSATAGSEGGVPLLDGDGHVNANLTAWAGTDVGAYETLPTAEAVAAIQAKTDQMRFSVANKMDATAAIALTSSSTDAGTGTFSQDFVVGAGCYWGETIEQDGLETSDWLAWELAIKADADADTDADALVVLRVSNPGNAGADGIGTWNRQPASGTIRALGTMTATAAGGNTTVSWAIFGTAMALPPTPVGKSYVWELNSFTTSKGRQLQGTGSLQISRTVLRSPTVL